MSVSKVHKNLGSRVSPEVVLLYPELNRRSKVVGESPRRTACMKKDISVVWRDCCN